MTTEQQPPMADSRHQAPMVGEVVQYAPQPAFQQPAYQYPGYQQPPVVIVRERKSVVLAVLLGLLFGPLGMLYSTVVGALIMLIVYIIGGFLGGIISFATFGIGLVIVIPMSILLQIICATWSGLAASFYNDSLGTR